MGMETKYILGRTREAGSTSERVDTSKISMPLQGKHENTGLFGGPEAHLWQMQSDVNLLDKVGKASEKTAKQTGYREGSESAEGAEGAERGEADEFQRQSEWAERVNGRYVEMVARRFEGHVDAFRGSIRRLLEQPENSKFLPVMEEVDISCDYLLGQLHALLNSADRDQLRAAATLPLTIDYLTQVVHDLEHQMRDPSTKAATQQKKTKPGLFKGLLEKLLRAKKDLWKLICDLATPAEMTLKGDVDVPFLASAGMEIKFVQAELREPQSPELGSNTRIH